MDRVEKLFDDRGPAFTLGMGISFCVCTSVLITSIFLIGFSYRVVDYDQYGLLYSQVSRKILDDKAYTAGRYFVGLGQNFHRFNATFRTIEFSRAAGINDTARSQFYVRATDGQNITLELSFQYAIKPDDLKQLYIDYKHDYESYYVRTAYSLLRDVAAQYASEQFFFERHLIEAHMLSELVYEIGLRHADVKGFQLREIQLPASLDDRLLQIQLQIQIARERTATINTTTIEATTTKMVNELQAQRSNLLATIEQETEVMRTKIARNTSLVKQETERLRTQIQISSSTSLAIYRQATENERLLLAKNLSFVEITTDNLVRLIELDADVREARKDAEVRVVRAEAEATRIALVEGARVAADRLLEIASVTAFANLTDSLNMTVFEATHFVWMEAFAEHNPNRVFLDLFLPDDLYLPGQKDAFYANA